jgi:hypothetical protein
MVRIGAPVRRRNHDWTNVQFTASALKVIHTLARRAHQRLLRGQEVAHTFDVRRLCIAGVVALAGQGKRVHAGPRRF